MNSKRFFLVILVLAVSIAVRAQTGNLQIAVAGLVEAKGKVYIAIYNSADGWTEYNKSYKVGTVEVKGKTVTYVFKGLPYGTYGLTAFQDLNGNGDMDYNWIGYPTEPFGFGNNAKVTLSAPAFGDASVKLDKSVVTAGFILHN